MTFQVNVAPTCFDKEAFRDCYYDRMGLAHERCSEPSTARLYPSLADCMAEVGGIGLRSRCVTGYCREQPLVEPYDPFPVGTYSEVTKRLQEDLNFYLAVFQCEPIAEHGMLDAATCGAAEFVDPTGGMVPPTCTSFQRPSCPGLEPEETALPVSPDPIIMPVAPAPSSRSTTQAWMMLGGLGLVTAVAVGWYVTQKRKR